LDEAAPDALIRRTDEAAARLSELTGGYEAGRIVRRGVATAIVGRPNVGKSSLMNRLFGARRSIVADLPGTTRDVVEAEAIIGGIRFILADTAGLRDSADGVEQMGVALSYERLANADLVLCVLDGGEPLTDADKAFVAGLSGRRAVVALNKSDRPRRLFESDIPDFGGDIVTVSAATGEGMDTLAAAMAAACALPGSADAMLLANRRQLDCALRALAALAETRDALVSGVTLDAVAALLDGAIAPLRELTGRQVSDSVIDALFAKFCVGK
jgi:tRNA modification GTPase